jgi:hypothetical protein
MLHCLPSLTGTGLILRWTKSFKSNGINAAVMGPNRTEIVLSICRNARTIMHRFDLP